MIGQSDTWMLCLIIIGVGSLWWGEPVGYPGLEAVPVYLGYWLSAAVPQRRQELDSDSHSASTVLFLRWASPTLFIYIQPVSLWRCKNIFPNFKMCKKVWPMAILFSISVNGCCYWDKWIYMQLMETKYPAPERFIASLLGWFWWRNGFQVEDIDAVDNVCFGNCSHE